MTRKQSFVTFLSPGTFFDESTTKGIEGWDPKMAAKMAADVRERHGARPYGFYFTTDIVSDPVPDGEGGTLEVKGKEIARSGTYYIDGTVRTLADVERDARGDESILRSNMRGNGWAAVCETTNGYRHVGLYSDEDFVVSASGKVTREGLK